MTKNAADKLVELFRSFASGDLRHDCVRQSQIADLIGREDVTYAATLHVEDGIPYAFRIKGDKFDAANDRAATEAAQEIFG